MRRLAAFLFLLISVHGAGQTGKPAASKPPGRYVLVIHGGAGTILKSQMTPEKEKAYQSALDSALQAGETILARGGTALDAVEASVRVLEDNPLFNSGKGAVFTNAGKNELDAAIMDGATLKAGAIAGVTTIRNPVSTARQVMENSEHVMLTGKGAEEFAMKRGETIVDPSYFYTEARWQGLLKARAEDSLEGLKKDSLKAGVQPPAGTKGHALRQLSNRDNKYGTVGAVALDQQGNLAAATSTGGMTNKKFGRVGDAPIIGAGTYANNNTVAISGTGWGEYYIRLVMAKTISDMMEYGKLDLKTASNRMVMEKLPALGGDGGLIAVDKKGNIALPFCTEGMYRGYVKQGEKKVIAIYKN
ncbi:MAG: isoaspartyl peptidase/L-asparaginase [Chitinophagaceae bacterium]|nr:MAG: isoaspartyl peptidase/L-asparaginase [Chitinophagaceae bacterium]